jgi:hypothetical protein
MAANNTVDTSDAVSIAPSQQSTTSTEMFEHESFSAFQHKVKTLCKKNSPALSNSAFEITHMEGGSCNRVVRLTVDFSKTRSTRFQRHAKHLLNLICPSTRFETKETTKSYVVRMPRFEHAWFEYEVAILLYLANTSVPAPRIKYFDVSSANELGSRYTVQPLLPGRSVQEGYLDLNTAQRISFARSLGKALKNLHAITSPCPGTLDPNDILSSNRPTMRTGQVGLLQVQCPPRNAMRSPSNEQARQATLTSAYDFIKLQISHQCAYDTALSRCRLNLWDKLAAIIDALHGEGLFYNNTFYLSHMDFEPRNILLNTRSPEDAYVSGILDWDESLFAPVFLSCRPPSWLWDFEGDEDDELDEKVAHVDPKEPDLLAVKRSFEEAVGEEWCGYAYKTEYRLARDIVRLAILGIRHDGDYAAVEELVREWDALRPDCAVGGIGEIC